MATQGKQAKESTKTAFMSDHTYGVLPAETHDEKPVLKPCSVAKLFSLAEGWDYAHLVLGIFFAIVSGWCPIVCSITLSFLAGDMAAAYFTGDYDLMMDQALIGVRFLALVATIWVGTGSLQAYGLKSFKLIIVYRMRRQYLKAMLNQDMAWYDSESVASLPIQINADIDQIAEGLGDKFSQTVFAISCVISGYASAFWLGWQVALVMCSTVPLIAGAQSVQARVVSAVHMDNQAHYAKAAEVVEESLYAIKTVISLGYERQAISRFEAVMEMVRRTGVRKGWKTGALLGFTWISQLCCYALCFWFGATCIRDGVINNRTGKVWVGKEVVAVFLTIFTSSQLLGLIDPGVSALRKARLCAARMFELNEKQPFINCHLNRKDTRKPLKHIESILFDNVFFHYPSRPDSIVLNGTTLDIKKGQRVAFVGSSGCGKSTVISLLERYYDPTQGKVLVNGEDLKIFSIGTVRKCFGYVGQEPVLFNGTIRENVIRGCPKATEEEIELVLEQAQCYFIQTFPDGMETNGGGGGCQLSGGQKQRIAIARALIMKPLVLLLDEATSALDNVAEKKIEETLDKLIAERDGCLTTISIAHRLSTIRSSDCIFMFSHGVITEKGSHRELMLMQGEYASLAESTAAAMIAPDNSDTEDEDDDEPKEPKGPGDESTPFVCRIVTTKSGLPGRTTVGFGASSDLLDQRTHTCDISLPLDEAANRENKTAEKKYKAPLSRLMSFNRQEWWCIPLACGGALATGGSFPFIGKLVVLGNQALYNPDKEVMYKDCTEVAKLYVLIMIFMYIGTTIQFGTCGILAEAMIKRMRIAVFTHILRQEIGFHDNPHHDPAMLGSNIQQWAFRVSSLSDAICVNFSTLGAIIIGVSMAVYYCWPVAILMCVCFPIVAAATVAQALFSGASASTVEVPEAAKTLISESVQNAKTVQALDIQQDMVATFSKLTHPLHEVTWVQNKKKMLWISFLYGVTTSVMMYVLTLNYWFTAYLIKTGYTNYLDSNRALMSIYYAAIGAGAAAVALGDNAKAQLAAKDMFALLDSKSKIDGLEPDGVMPPPGFQPGNIEFVRVTFAYPFRPQAVILRGMSFVVKSGQAVGLVGPSGGGKSTMYAMIQRFYDPQAGKVLVGVERMNLVDLNIRWWRSSIGFVGQEPVLFNATVKENVLYGAPEGTKVSQAQLTKFAEMANLDFMFENNGQGWETEVGPRGSRLSGGQKQRVAICRALVKNPPILLLDEATSALDNNSEQVVSKALEAARDGRTSFSIAHRLSTVEDCDIILVSANGKIVEKGKDAELMMKGGVYMKLQEAQGKDTFCCA